jgi:hypothetical protein
MEVTLQREIWGHTSSLILDDTALPSSVWILVYIGVASCEFSDLIT